MQSYDNDGAKGLKPHFPPSQEDATNTFLNSFIKSAEPWMMWDEILPYVPSPAAAHPHSTL